MGFGYDFALCLAWFAWLSRGCSIPSRRFSSALSVAVAMFLPFPFSLVRFARAARLVLGRSAQDTDLPIKDVRTFTYILVMLVFISARAYVCICALHILSFIYITYYKRKMPEEP